MLLFSLLLFYWQLGHVLIKIYYIIYSNCLFTYPVHDDWPSEDVGEAEDVGLLETGTGLARQTGS